ncbi:glucose-methanol-choline oxidoreductase [Armillaria luteobubalina]|uniref:Glucose-methanol-choline oxidoreductase n=1 Tax=Armillaria luteobubalina TaxID=153913 RepID=A0AA39UVJ8_9AGAR|nr:glucose-methanol-choline oxidoreductase [Armillaria luteobubalina]
MECPPHCQCHFLGGSVTINSTNPLDPPVIYPNYLTHTQDLAIMNYAVQSSKEFVTANAWKGCVLSIATNTTDEDIRNGVSNMNHPVSTASMSPIGADWGVVDPDLRLKGVGGVRIVDASILPLVPLAHIQAAVYMLAEKAADLIKVSAGM